MRKQFLLLVIIAGLALAMPAKAQIKFGLKLGTNISNTDFSEMREIDQLKDVAIKNNAGFFVGPVMDIKIPLLGFGADIALQYSYNSYTIETPEMQDRKSKQHMFEIPVHLKYNFDLGSILGLYVAAGPSFGFNINPDSFWKDLTIAVADKIDGNNTYKRNSTEVYLDFGAGLTILSKVQLGFTYNLGLTDAAKGRGVGGVVREAWNGNAVKSRVWKISATYIF